MRKNISLYKNEGFELLEQNIRDDSTDLGETPSIDQLIVIGKAAIAADPGITGRIRKAVEGELQQGLEADTDAPWESTDTIIEQ